MNISSKQAKKIVESLKDIIDYDINFIDLDCQIIASTDANRVGEYHEGSKIVFETKKPLIIEDDNEYLGTKAGINLPVRFDDNIVAAVGVTGTKNKVGKFSEIIVKMTEILLKEIYIKEQTNLKFENERYLIDLIINNLEEFETINERANSLNINLNYFKQIAIIKCDDERSKFINLRNMVFKSIRKRLKNDELVVSNHGNYLLLLNETDIKQLTYIKDYITSKYNIDVVIGLSDEIKNPIEISKKFNQVTQVANIAYNQKDYRIVSVNDFDLELILFDVSDNVKQLFLNKVFGDIKQKTINEWSEMLIAFVTNNGSICAASEELFIHKNTLQYRLNKIKELTGYDPRNLRDFTVLYAAISLLKY